MFEVIARSSNIESTPPPVLGLNTTDPATMLDPQYARKMLNFFPGEYSIKVREGYSQWVTGLPSAIETLIPYVKLDGTQHLFAATSDGLFNVTTSGTLVSLSLVALIPITEGRCSYTQFTNLAGNYLIICNDSTDVLYIYDGTTWTTSSYHATPTVLGQFSVNPQNLVSVAVHMRRLWFIEKNTLTAHYLPVDAITGTLAPFYLGSVFKKGGKLKAIFTWSTDSGEGMDDLIIFQSSEGELAAYRGTDPSSADTWTLDTAIYVAPPRTDRSPVSVGGDVWLLTSFGVLPVSTIAGSGGKALSQDLSKSRKIAKSITSELTARGQNANWEAHVHPDRQALFVLFPEATHPAVQFVMNLQTGAWTQYDMPMHTAVMLGDTLYFGDNAGTVYKWGGIYRDNIALDASSWDPIEAHFEAAYTDLGNRGQNKHYNLVRLLWVSHQHPTYVVSLSTDYYQNAAFYTWAYPPLQEEGDLWDDGLWGDAVWTAAPTARYRWDGVEGLGYTASLMLRIKTKRYVELAGIDWAYAIGASL